MTLREIAFRNLVRRKGKAAFILAGLVTGISTVVAVITFVEAMTQDINTKLEKYGANILIVPKTERLSLNYGGLSLGGVSFETEEIRESALDQVHAIRNAKNIAALGPVVLGVVTLNDRRVLLAGVDFKAARILKPWWKINGGTPDASGVVLGAEAARVLNLEQGDPVGLNGTSLKVAGILNATGSQDDQLIFSRLATAQIVLDKKGQVSMVEVAALCKDCPIDEMVKQISGALPGARVMAIGQVVKGRMETLYQFRKFSYGVAGVVILVGSLVVLVTMMGSVRERTEEIGIFRAVGFRKRHVMRIVMMEAAVISGLAGVVGYLLGLGEAKAALGFFASDRAVPVYFSLEVAAGALALAVIVGLLASIYPAVLAARMDPNEALRAL